MKAFLLKHAKQLFIFAILAIFFIGLLNYFAFNHWGIGCRPDPGPVPTVIVDDWTDTLITVGYEMADIAEDPIIPNDLPESVEGIIYADGTAGDMDVVISIVETPDDMLWIKATVNGDQVKFHKIEYSPINKPDNDTRFTGFVESAYVSGSTDWGIGLAYTLIRRVPIIKCSLGVFASADINPSLEDAPDWYAGGARVAWNKGAFSLGAHFGYRAMEDAGFHTGVDFGVAIGL